MKKETVINVIFGAALSIFFVGSIIVMLILMPPNTNCVPRTEKRCAETKWDYSIPTYPHPVCLKYVEIQHTCDN